MLAAMERLVPTYAQPDPDGSVKQLPSLSGDVINLTIDETPFRVGNNRATAITLNGTVPGPILRLREGQEVTINVTNRLKELTSIHWHGVLPPNTMDGVPGVSFEGIKPGTTFVYRFPITQWGTFWYHSHVVGQTQWGVYAPLIFDPAEPDPFTYDREFAVMLSDWTPRSEMGMIGKLKKESGYFNFQQRTVREFVRNAEEYGWKATWQNYKMWSEMRMDPTDLADVTSSTYRYLMNGLSPETNWTGLFRPGERIRLRFIQVGAMTFSDVRIPGLKMTVVAADGQYVQPVEVDEFRIGPGEVYDVIVEPKEDRAYTIFAEALDRSGYARGTLAPRSGMTAEIPPRRLRPLRTMQDMGMSMEGMSMDEMKLEMGENKKAGTKPMEMMDMNMPGMKPSDTKHQMPGMPSGERKPAMPGMPNMQHMPGMHSPHSVQEILAMANGRGRPELEKMPGVTDRSEVPGHVPVMHGPDDHGIGNQTTPEMTSARPAEAGIGLGGSGRRVLAYADLKALHPYPDQRQPERHLEIHLTGHMERFIWSLDGKKFSEARDNPVRFRLGERLRWTFVNDTMMEHTMHLHGMWMYLENGTGSYLPRKHTVLVKPAERVSVAITPTENGPWAFHCHLNLHMEAGMFRVVLVSDNLPEERS